MSKYEIERMAREAAERYNKYRAPEAMIKLLSVKDNAIEALISGSFCRSCGLYDWIEDYKYELMDMIGTQIEIVYIEQVNEESFKVKFKIK
ncbi:MAG: hypothetical protein NDF55_08200 [archaeon GB-1867-005]|nr:hypothetical protein [Candidatus Culexmicrobium cathedralense]